MPVSCDLRRAWGILKHSIHPQWDKSPNVLSVSPWSHFWLLDPPILFLVNGQWTHIYAILV
jgi:hypothetical protein